jgi:prolyl 4-hydroxylase
MENVFMQLPLHWQEWVKENLDRKCDPRGIVDLMVKSGSYNRKLANAAVRDAMGNGESASMPDINTSKNIIHTPDRKVNVLLTMAAPRIVVLGNVISEEECAQLTMYCDQRMERSPVVSDITGKMEQHAGRTSSGSMLQRGETELVKRIEARLAFLANWPVERGEGMQVLRYEKGNEYRPHFDWFDSTLPGPSKHLERGGQRLGTFVIYLSDVEEGGGTSFPSIGLEVQPQKGGAVFFMNTDSFLTPDQLTLHAGQPVVKGVKHVANKWLRERTY